MCAVWPFWIIRIICLQLVLTWSWIAHKRRWVPRCLERLASSKINLLDSADCPDSPILVPIVSRFIDPSSCKNAPLQKTVLWVLRWIDIAFWESCTTWELRILLLVQNPAASIRNAAQGRSWLICALVNWWCVVGEWIIWSNCDVKIVALSLLTGILELFRECFWAGAFNHVGKYWVKGAPAEPIRCGPSSHEFLCDFRWL